MRAALLHHFGDRPQVGDADEPPVGEGESTVDVQLAGVNPLDLRVCAGGAGQVPLPFVPGVDGIGTVDGVPVAVYGSGIGLQRPGTYAERVAVPEASVVLIPSGLDLTQAAAIGLAGVTAWGVVHESAAVTADDRVLVLGASGGVGTLAVQLARATGAQVWAQTSRDEDGALPRDLGAEQVVVTDAAGLRVATKALAPTVVVDALGGEFTVAAVQALRPRGRLVVVGSAAGASAALDVSLLYRKAITIRGHASLMLTPAAARAALEQCLAAAADGALRAHVDSVLPLDDVAEAHRRLAAREATGKILLAVAG